LKVFWKGIAVNTTVVHPLVRRNHLTKAFMSRADPQFNLRIPAELKTRIEDAAKHNKRSATAEIIARLEESFASASHRIVRAVEPATQGDAADLEEIELNLGIVLEQVKHFASTRHKQGRPLGVDTGVWVQHKLKENAKDK
jgi:hypothetical protein